MTDMCPQSLAGAVRGPWRGDRPGRSPDGPGATGGPPGPVWCMGGTLARPPPGGPRHEGSDQGPSGPYRLLTRALTAGVLVSASACSLHGVMRPADAPSVVPPATSTPSLTDAQASAALITQGELGGRWSATQGGATWRDGLLKTRTDAPDCQRLLDGLYAEDLLGEPTGARAVVGLDESGNAAQLRYQVAAYAARSEVDAELGLVADAALEVRAVHVHGRAGWAAQRDGRAVGVPGWAMRGRGCG